MYYLYGEVCDAVEKVVPVSGVETESTIVTVQGDRLLVDVKNKYINDLIEDFNAEHLYVEDSDDGQTFVVAVKEQDGKVQSIKRRIQIDDVDTLREVLEEIGQGSAGERERAMAAEQALDEKIDAEISRAELAEQTIHDDLQAEINRASLAEQSLSDDISDEAQARDEVQSNLDDEIQARISADNTLRAKIEKEVRDRIDAIEGIGDGITEETSRAEQAEQALAEALSEENERALQAERNIASNVTEERLRALEAEAGLLSKINKEIADRIADVDEEEARAVVAEQLIDEKLDQEIYDRKQALDNLDYTDTPDDTKFVSQVDEEAGVISVTRRSFDPVITEIDGTSFDAPKLNITIADNTSADTVLSKASTSIYGATKLTSTLNDNEETLATTPKYIDNKVKTLDVSDTADPTKYVSSVSETDGKISVSRTLFNPSITIGAGTSSSTPTVNVTVAGNSGVAQSITTASTSVYGATRLTSVLNAGEEGLAATPKYVDNAIKELDATVSQAASTDGLALSITETDGKITALTGSIASNTYDSYGDAATVKAELLGDAATSYNTLGKLEDYIIDINSKIPAQASSSNQLADKDYVTDSIITSAGFFRGSFATYAALTAVQWQTTDPTQPYFVSNNDYAYVEADETHNNEAWRYLYVNETGNANNGWTAQFKINDTPFTSAQMAAINSGITSALVTQIGTNQTNITNLQADKADKTATVSTVTYDTTNKKITKTINGTTTDVVSVATIKSDMDLSDKVNVAGDTMTGDLTLNSSSQLILNAPGAGHHGLQFVYSALVPNINLTHQGGTNTTPILQLSGMGSNGVEIQGIAMGAVSNTSSTTATNKGYVDNLHYNITSPQYSSASTYVIGDVAIQGGKLYRCTTAIDTPEAWNSSHWQQVNVVELIEDSVPDLSSYMQKGVDYVTAGKKSGTVLGSLSTAEGYNTISNGTTAHAEGNFTVASGDFAHAEGSNTIASGYASHAEGEDTVAVGDNSHAEGYNTTASGTQSHAEGDGTVASGDFSHAEGDQSQAGDYGSHAEGRQTIATGVYSHAEGYKASASAYAAHAEGESTIAGGNYSHAEGYLSRAQRRSQHVFGEYNIAESGDAGSKGIYVEIVGNGGSDSNRSNARTLDWNGNQWNAGTIKIGGTSYNDTNAKEVATKEYVDNNMVILSYGNSIWQDFIDAYNKNSVVYCRASSNDNPATGSQTRLAFMAYVNNATNPTNVEFQYYRSMSAHTISQQGDQVFVYKLDKTAGWTVTAREASAKIVAGTGLSSTYSNDTLTLTRQDELPSQSGQSGKFLTTDGTNVSWTTVSAGTVNKYAETIAVTTAIKTFIINHGLGTNDVVVNIYDVATGKDVIADITRSESNGIYTLTIDFDATTPAGSYRVVVIG